MGNNDRGVRVAFNEMVLKNFLEKNDLDLLYRAQVLLITMENLIIQEL